ncbi:MAG TPA: MBL fold metallo-hydrolase [Anaerolineaceae bacterium]|nr:MBL fold metallo-hydrolase [Anaerolineaceae bacterium]
MGRLIVLGTANAVANEHHENTHFVLLVGERAIMVDCVGNPVIRLRQVGIDFNQVTDLILTHFHPDHVSGMPLLLMDMWLMQRKRPLHIYGLKHTIDRAITTMTLYEWETWPNFFPVIFHRLPDEEKATILDEPEVRVFASPGDHHIPTIGIRIEFPDIARSVAYSSDTEPCDAIARLAENVDVLIHEASGASVGHSSAAQAGEVAQRAGAQQLYLVHYPPEAKPEALVSAARTGFQGPIHLATDLMEITLV